MTTGKRDPYAHFRKQNKPPDPPRFDDGDGGGGEDGGNDDLLCSTHGCTSRWTVQGPYGLKCSKHYWNDADQFPAVRTMRDWTGPHYPGDMKGWARRLKDAHEAGWPLTEYQVSCYKTALRIE
jgi:hypothetical protein